MTRREALLFVIAFMVLATFTILRPPVRHSYQPTYPTVYESPEEVNDYGDDYTVFTLKTDPNHSTPITISDMTFIAGCSDAETAEAFIAIIMGNEEVEREHDADKPPICPFNPKPGDGPCCPLGEGKDDFIDLCSIIYEPEWEPTTSPIAAEDLKVRSSPAPWEYGWKRTRMVSEEHSEAIRRARGTKDAD